MKSSLFRELGTNLLFSLLLYSVVFGLLWGMEYLFPSLQGKLLALHLADGSLNYAFLIGIPASILGTGYVLTIRNPNNYLGFYPGIIMSLLLAIQLYLQGSYDLFIMYIIVFTPFQLSSLIRWRKQWLLSQQEVLTPSFLPTRKALWVGSIGVIIVGLDYIINSLWVHADGFTTHILLKLLSGIMIASSILANFLMIFKKNDAWIGWVLYALSGCILFIFLGNIFSIVMFSIMTAVNLSAQMAWFRITRPEDMGWLQNPRTKTKTKTKT